MAFELPALPYAYDALEPHIDARTMEIHHGKHHNGYTTKLNAAVEGTDLAGKSIEDICSGMDMNNAGVRNNGGGYFNHNLFWSVMSPNGGGAPTGEVADAINAAYGSYDAFKDAFAKAAATRFGSGWAWLCVMDGGAVEVCSSANQDNPLMPGIGCGGTPHPRSRCLGARLLPELPEPPSRLHHGVLQCHQLGRSEPPLRSC